jgi:hypothetical protein
LERWTYGPKTIHGYINAPCLLEERPGVVVAAL